MNEKISKFKALCKNVGLKITPQRLEIYKVLINSGDHPSADMVHKRIVKEFPSVSLDTVNRTLLTFNEIGVAFIVEGSGDVRRYDAGMESHQHFKCIRCKRIIDFHYAPFDNIATPSGLEDFEIMRKAVYFEGLCDECKLLED